MKKEDRYLELDFINYEHLGQINAIRVTPMDHGFSIHLCGSKTCDNVNIPMEKYDI